MDDLRFKERYEHYKEAFQRLDEAVSAKLNSRLEKDGLIQRFEFTFELAWKVLKDWLNYKGFEVSAPRDVFQTAFQEGLIDDFDGWLKMLEFRNVSSHEYSLEKADELLEIIRKKFFVLFQKLNNALKEKK